MPLQATGLRRLCAGVAAALLLVACAPTVVTPGPPTVEPALVPERGYVRMHDDVTLPLRVWLPEDGARPRAAIVALHGFNDYSEAYADIGPFMAERGMAVYAYDQRGFGRAPNTGYWPGTEGLVHDLSTVAWLVRERHPDVPLYVLGESMGGAVAMVAAAAEVLPPVEGLILSAPAVWGRSTMPGYQQVALWLASSIVPWLRVTGEGLDIMPTDNMDALRKLSADPLVIKETRIDTIKGLVDLMDQALASAPRLHVPALILYGARDEVVPPEPTYRMIAELPNNPVPQRVALYPEGWHLLMRDLQAEVVLRDIAAWIEAPGRPLPSGADENAWRVLTRKGIVSPALAHP